VWERTQKIAIFSSTSNSLLHQYLMKYPLSFHYKNKITVFSTPTTCLGATHIFMSGYYEKKLVWERRTGNLSKIHIFMSGYYEKNLGTRSHTQKKCGNAVPTGQQRECQQVLIDGRKQKAEGEPHSTSNEKVITVFIWKTKHNWVWEPVSSEISDLCEISDLLFFSVISLLRIKK